MQVQLKPWGNSQGIRFSREFLRSAGIGPEDTLTAEVSDGKIILSKAFVHRGLRERAAAYGGRSPGTSRWAARCGEWRAWNRATC